MSESWILLRGLAREKAHWGPFLDKFRASLKDPECEILCLDLPGFGEFSEQTSPSNLTAIFNHVRGLAIERTRGAGQFKVLAVSLGAMVAMEWLNQRPEDLKEVVMINTSSNQFSPAYHRLRWQVWGEICRLLTVQTARAREHGIVDLLMNNAEARAEALPLWTRIALERPVSYVSFFNQLIAAARFRGLRSAPNVPVLLLNSLGDRLVDPSCSEQLHKQWGWVLKRHPWAGHDLPWDDAQFIIASIKDWEKTLKPIQS